MRGVMKSTQQMEERKMMKSKALIATLLLTAALLSVGSPNIYRAYAVEPIVRHWGLIVQGYMSSDFIFEGDSQYMYHLMTEHFNFEDVCYLSVNTDLPGVTNETTKANVKWAITQWLQRSGPNDVILIFFPTHGGGYRKGYDYANNPLDQETLKSLLDQDGDEGNETRESTLGFDINEDGNTTDDWVGIDETLYLPNDEFYSDDELREDLADLQYSKLIFTTTACFSGGLIDDLSASNRIIMTAANETDPAARVDSYSSTNLSPWARHFMDALHGELVCWTSSYRLVHTGTKVNADTNEDGKVSMYEAWDYSWNSNPYRLNGEDTPWIDDNGNGKPTYWNESDQLDPTDGAVADATWLPWSRPRNRGFEQRGASVYDCVSWNVESGWRDRKGDINEDGVVDIFDVVRVTSVYGSKEGYPDWDPLCDLDGDGDVDIFDVVMVTSQYGTEATRLMGAYSWYSNGSSSSSFTMWQQLDEIGDLPGRSVEFGFYFYPETSSQTATAKIYYETPSGGQWIAGSPVNGAADQWNHAYVSASIPSNTIVVQTWIQGQTSFKAYIDNATLTIQS